MTTAARPLTFSVTKHGTTTGYAKRCRCDECRKASRDYRRRVTGYDFGASRWRERVERVIRGDYRIHSNGYILLYCPMHPATPRRSSYVYEHVAVAEVMLGRSLLRGEHVHHRNEAKDDNRPGNLEVLTVVEHRHRHRKTHCIRGHVLDERNVYVRPDNGSRQCRACCAIRERRRGK